MFGNIKTERHLIGVEAEFCIPRGYKNLYEGFIDTEEFKKVEYCSNYTKGDTSIEEKVFFNHRFIDSERGYDKRTGMTNDRLDFIVVHSN